MWIGILNSPRLKFYAQNRCICRQEDILNGLARRRHVPEQFLFPFFSFRLLASSPRAIQTASQTDRLTVVARVVVGIRHTPHVIQTLRRVLIDRNHRTVDRERAGREVS